MFHLEQIQAQPTQPMEAAIDFSTQDLGMQKQIPIWSTIQLHQDATIKMHTHFHLNIGVGDIDFLSTKNF